MKPWHSNDGTIPHQLFLLLKNCIPSIEAGEELRIAHGTARGQGLFNNGDNNQLQSAMRHLIQQAFPERFD